MYSDGVFSMNRRQFLSWSWKLPVLMGFSSLSSFVLPRESEAALTRVYVDNRLTSGANNGTSPSDAYRSLEHMRAGIAGTTTDEVYFVPGSGPYQEAFGTRITRYKTDLSFQASDRSLNSTVTALNTFSFAPGDIVQVFGSPLNSRQFTIATVAVNKITFIASNIVQDEAAGAQVNVTSLTNGSNLSAMDLAGNGTSGRYRRWLLNGCEIDCGRTLNESSGFQWIASRITNEWYVKRSDGSNPSFIQPTCGVLDNQFIADSASLGYEMGTVGSLNSSRDVMGWGDNDSIGYNTVYLYSVKNPNQRLVRIGQVASGVWTTWQYHSIEDGVFTLGNRAATNGVGIYNSSTTLWYVKRCLFRYQANHAVEQTATSTTIVQSCVSYFSGHRGYYLGGNGTLRIHNCLDYGSHLFALIAATVTGAGTLELYNNVSAFNEAGAIDKKSAAAVLDEQYNVWFPRFEAAGAALGYISTANWPTTHATDFPASAATTIATVAANEAAGAINPRIEISAGSTLTKEMIQIRQTSQCSRNGKMILFLRDLFDRVHMLPYLDRGPLRLQ